MTAAHVRWPWCDLSGIWDTVRAHALRWDAQKRGFRSNRYWNATPSFIGLLGETVYGRYMGLPVDYALRLEGAPGADFPGAEVKTAGGRHWRNPHLLHPPTGPWLAPRFVLAAIDERLREGALVGWVAAAELRAAPCRNWGYGPQHSVHHARLRPFPLPFLSRHCACGQRRTWSWLTGAWSGHACANTSHGQEALSR